MKTSLYNNDGTLSAQAQSLLSTKPDDMSMAEWKKTLKKFRAQLSAEESKEFKSLIADVSSKSYYYSNKKKVRERQKAYREANKEKAKAYREANKEKAKAYQKEHYTAYYQSNKEKIKAYHQTNKEKRNARSKAYREANKEKVKAHYKAHYEANKEKRKILSKNYYLANKEKIKAQQKIYIKSNPDKINTPQKKLRHAVCQAFKRIGKNKPTNTLELLGCSWEEAKAHIEGLWQEGMSWENHERYGWHIDHIRPVSSFEDHELDQMNHISNLQPLWWQDNLSKSDKW